MMTTQEQIDWRRDQVIKHAAKGLSITEISKILQVDISTISRDVKHLKEQAKQNIRNYLDEVIPHEFEKALRAIEEVQKQAWIISSSTEDEKLKLQALTLAKDATVQKVDLLTNADAIDSAVSFVKSAQKQLDPKIASKNEAIPSMTGEGQNDIGSTQEESSEPGQYNATF